MTTENDWLVAIHEESERALAQGEAKGRAEGIAEGEARGEARGKAKGRIEGIAAVAKKMLAAGVDIGDIQKFTGLTKEEVEKL